MPVVATTTITATAVATTAAAAAAATAATAAAVVTVPTTTVPTTTCEDPLVASPDAGYRQCPICNSWDTTRHAEGYRVWFTCNRCGAVFA